MYHPPAGKQLPTSCLTCAARLSPRPRPSCAPFEPMYSREYTRSVLFSLSFFPAPSFSRFRYRFGVFRPRPRSASGDERPPSGTKMADRCTAAARRVSPARLGHSARDRPLLRPINPLHSIYVRCVGSTVLCIFRGMNESNLQRRIRFIHIYMIHYYCKI